MEKDFLEQLKLLDLTNDEIDEYGEYLIGIGQEDSTSIQERKESILEFLRGTKESISDHHNFALFTQRLEESLNGRLNQEKEQQDLERQKRREQSQKTLEEVTQSLLEENQKAKSQQKLGKNPVSAIEDESKIIQNYSYEDVLEDDKTHEISIDNSDLEKDIRKNDNIEKVIKKEHELKEKQKRDHEIKQKQIQDSRIKQEQQRKKKEEKKGKMKGK